MLRDENGNILTEEEQVAYVLSLSDTGSGPSSAAVPAPTPSPIPTPPAPQISLLVTLSTRSGSRTLAPPALLPTEVVLVDGDPDQPDVASISSAGPVDGTAPKRTTGNAIVREATAPVDATTIPHCRQSRRGSSSCTPSPTHRANRYR